MKKFAFFILKALATIALAYGTLWAFVILAIALRSKGIFAIIRTIGLVIFSIIIAINIWFPKNKHKKKFLIIEIILFILVVGEGAYTELKYKYEKSITIDNSILTINTNKYMPFRENSEIVRLEEEASLKLEDNLPIVDGAAAVFPVYSAFVNEVYPEEKVMLNSRNVYSIASNGETGEHEVFDLEEGVFQYNNTVTGYQKLARKEIDIFFGAYPSEQQISFAKVKGTTFKCTPIGREGFVFFVNKDNPVENLTSEQIRKIYSGEITNWKEVGGKNEEILAFQRNEGSGSQSMLIRFMGDKPIKEPIKNEYQDSMGMIIDSVANYRNHSNSIGFSFRYYAEDIIGNQNVKLISVDGVAPTQENITNETYPITTDLYAVTYEGNPNENVDKLIEWALSEQGQYIITETGYAPVK